MRVRARVRCGGVERVEALSDARVRARVPDARVSLRAIARDAPARRRARGVLQRT